MLHHFLHRKSKHLPPYLPLSTAYALCMYVSRFWNPNMVFWITSVKQQALCKAIQPKMVVKGVWKNTFITFSHRKSKPLPLYLPYCIDWAVCMYVFRFWNPNMALWKTSVKQQAV